MERGHLRAYDGVNESEALIAKPQRIAPMNPIISECFVRDFASSAAADLSLRQALSQVRTTPSMASQLAGRVTRAIHQVLDPRGFALAEAAKVVLPDRDMAVAAPLIAPVVTLHTRQPAAAKLDAAA